MAVATKKKASTRDIRTGVVVETKIRGIGIVTFRKKNIVWIAHPTKEGSFLPCERYEYKSLEGISLSEQSVAPNSNFHKLAWNHILTEAYSDDLKYEYKRSERAIKNLPRLKGVTYQEREESFPYGHAKYLRMTMEGVFDFEISTYPTAGIGVHEKIEYMKALWSGDTSEHYLLDYNGNFFRRIATPEDLQYGEAYGWAKKDKIED